jgi:uncharacterized protein involved in exopolysaccharide biosynthesis
MEETKAVKSLRRDNRAMLKALDAANTAQDVRNKHNTTLETQLEAANTEIKLANTEIKLNQTQLEAANTKIKLLGLRHDHSRSCILSLTYLLI